MARTYQISEEQISEIVEYRKTNKDKNIDKRLRAVQLRGEGYKNGEIAAIVEAHSTVVSRWVCKYVNEGIKALLDTIKSITGRHWILSTV